MKTKKRLLREKKEVRALYVYARDDISLGFFGGMIVRARKSLSLLSVSLSLFFSNELFFFP